MESIMSSGELYTYITTVPFPSGNGKEFGKEIWNAMSLTCRQLPRDLDLPRTSIRRYLSRRVEDQKEPKI